MNNCLNCNKETKNPKYCCRSCSATITGKLFPKRKSKKKCIKCDSFVKHYQTKYCNEHIKTYSKSNDPKNTTIGEYKNRISVKNKHPSWINSHIRGFARTWLKHLTKLPCAKCGYDKHVELAHIKSVSSYSDNTLLSIVNSEDNVIQLCPNCHWEFDNLPRN